MNKFNVSQNVKKMKTFKIFVKSEKFFWSRSRIIGISFLILFAIFIFKVYVIGKTENDIIEKISGFSICILMFLGLINSLRKQQIPGKLEGILKLETDGVTIGNKKYLLEEIRLIKFQLNDYIGKQVSANVGLWEIFSIGIDNKIILILNTGETIVTNFQRQAENELMWNFKELNKYYEEGKMIKKNYDQITK